MSALASIGVAAGMCIFMTAAMFVALRIAVGDADRFREMLKDAWNDRPRPFRIPGHFKRNNHE
ncbi:hypothetical protein ACHMZP_21640 [Rhodococcus baikonurensis]|uniref:hypothetical protein n=1 Tax=Rhodococcus baikonurensis TaxID=172041 RepID=UPI0037AB4A85